MLKETTKEILKIFKNLHYPVLTLEQLGQHIKNLEQPSLDQRIRRNPDVFEWYGKPKRIRVKTKLSEVVFFTHNYICLRCHKQFPEDQLTVAHLSFEIDDVDNYNNLTAICFDCAKIIYHVSDLTTIPITIDKVEQYDGAKWEYRRVTIKKEEIHQKNAIDPMFYYVFQEDSDDSRVWKHVALGDTLDAVVKSTIQDILNFYGKQGWECIQYTPPLPPIEEVKSVHLPNEFGKETELIFKREI